MEDETIQENFNDFETLVQSDWWLTLIVAFCIILVTVILSQLAASLIKRILADDRNLLPSSSIFVNIVRGVIWFAGLCAVLGICFNVDITAGIAALGIGGIALSLGLQDTISNLIGGLQVSLMKIVEPGDNIKVGSDTGTVCDVTWRHTTILTPTGEKVIIPNSIINKQALVQLAPVESIAVYFVVESDGADLDNVASSIQRACTEGIKDRFVLTKQPTVTFTEITDYGFRGKVCFAIDDASQANAAKDRAVRSIAPYTR